ncbi:MAG: outer membrane protein assembly factor [Deltaproteobacteria bacterium]
MSRPAPALALLALAACATPYQPFEGHPVLAAIRFQGNDHVSAGELMDHIATAPTSGFFSKTARYYDADLFAIDLKRIVRWYNRKGFYEAKILGVDELRDDAGRVTLLVKIDEGRPSKIRKMTYKGLEQIPSGEMDDIDSALPIHAGDSFNEDGYERAKDVLVEQLKEHGFAQAAVQGKVEVAPEAGTADIVYDVDPGQRFQFDKVVVTGNKEIPADAIARATGIDSGDRYSPLTLALAQQRVYNLGTFSGVRVSMEPLGESPRGTVRVNVREAPFQTVRFGVGGSVEQGRWELPRLRAEYTNRSLFGGLRRLELNSTAGYAFVPSALPSQYDSAQSGITTLTSAQLTIPSVLVAGMDWVSRVEFAREVQSGFSYDDIAGRTGLTWRRGPHTVSGTLNYVRYFSVAVQGTQGLGRLVNLAGAGIAQECRDGCMLTYPEVRYAYDARDNIIEPTQGFFITMGLQQTVKPGNFSYFRINPEIRAYSPATRYAVLALRALYGGLFTTGDSPFTQRFFLGGQNDMRGYSPLRQGPKLGVAACDPAKSTGCTQPFATQSVPIGGNAAVLFSAELRIHADYLLNHLGIVTFVDASRVGDDPRQPFSDGLEVAPGVGLRYITPFGPIRFDVAWIANPKDVPTQPLKGKDANGNDVTVTVPTRVSSFCSGKTADCIHESRFAFHLTLGEAF